MAAEKKRSAGVEGSAGTGGGRGLEVIGLRPARLNYLGVKALDYSKALHRSAGRAARPKIGVFRSEF
jgi:hypothetical protein